MIETTVVVCLVVSRYDEELSWLHDVTHEILKDPGYVVQVYLYNKGRPDVDLMITDPRVTVRMVPLPNVGRESHTYLEHVVRMRSQPRGDRCNGITVFLQGRMDDHIPTGYRSIASFVSRMVDQASRSASGESRNHACHTMFGSFNAVPGLRVAMFPGVGDSGRDFGTWFSDMIGPWRWSGQGEGGPTWWQHGVFAIITSRLISLDVDDSYFLSLRSQVDWHVNPEAGHYFERSWCYVFPPLQIELP